MVWYGDTGWGQPALFLGKAFERKGEQIFAPQRFSLLAGERRDHITREFLLADKFRAMLWDCTACFSNISFSLWAPDCFQITKTFYLPQVRQFYRQISCDLHMRPAWHSFPTSNRIFCNIKQVFGTYLNALPCLHNVPLPASLFESGPNGTVQDSPLRTPFALPT